MVKNSGTALSPSERKVINAIYSMDNGIALQTDGYDFREIANEVRYLTEGSAATILTKLESKGLVRRMPKRPNYLTKALCTPFVLTAAGQALAPIP